MVEIPLRERKAARTKAALFQAAIKRLKNRFFDDIAVKELCHEAMVSEATFFNYFSKKTDLLVFFVRLFVLELAWHARQATGNKEGLDAIHAIFDLMADSSIESHRVATEVIGFFARQRDEVVLMDISKADRLAVYPNRSGIENIPDQTIEMLLGANIRAAIAKGELPPGTDAQKTTMGLVAMFFGLQLALDKDSVHMMKDLFQHQLNLLWTGLRNQG